MWLTEKSRRITILTIIISSIIALLIIRLAWMQLLQGSQYKKIANENRTRTVYIQAPRGEMYDRNGAVLVSSRPSFAVSVIPAEYNDPATATPLLASILNISPPEITAMLSDAAEFPYTPVRLQRDVDEVTIAKIEERKDNLPGVQIEAIPVRNYLYQRLAAHLFGYVGRIDAEEYAVRKAQGYHPDDLVGKTGLERAWEDSLRGVDGGRALEVNAAGQQTGQVREKPAVVGGGLALTFDANLQKAAEDALTAQILASRQQGEPAKGGAVVVLDVRTGGVLALASNPAFDPNYFAAGISSKNWQELISDPNNPLTNRAISSAYPPGSVFKIITAAAALDMGLTTPSEVFEDKGVYILSGWHFYGWNTKGLGRLNITDAIAWSSDPVFYELGHRLGPDNLAAYALTFGLGRKSGIKLEGEMPGVVPTPDWKQQTYGEAWFPGETLIAAIGQGYYLVTPLQQALLLQAVANGGIIYRPRLVDRLLAPDGRTITSYAPEIMQTVYLPPEVWDTIRQGLQAVTTRGTASAVFAGLTIPIAGKTGSAETGRKTTHAWFACYAPASNPEIAVAAFVDEGGEGSVAAAPVVRKVLEQYFKLPVQAAPLPPIGTTD